MPSPAVVGGDVKIDKSRNIFTTNSMQSITNSHNNKDLNYWKVLITLQNTVIAWIGNFIVQETHQEMR